MGGTGDSKLLIGVNGCACLRVRMDGMSAGTNNPGEFKSLWTKRNSQKQSIFSLLGVQ